MSDPANSPASSLEAGLFGNQALKGYPLTTTLTGPILTPQHASYLANHAIDVDLAIRLGVRSAVAPDDLPTSLIEYGSAAVPSIVFPWTVGGETWYQIRLDTPLPDSDVRYLFEKGAGKAVWRVHDAGRKADGVLLVEGTKQALAVASLDPDWHVYAMAGCHGWSHDHMVRPTLFRIAKDLPLVAIIDADLSTNPNVWEAARGLLDNVKIVTRASSVKIARTPGKGVTGVDDYLAAHDPDERADLLRLLIDTATDRLGKQPGHRPTGDGLDEIPMVRGKLDPAHLAVLLDRRRPYAVGPDLTTLYLYKRSKGIYQRQLNMTARLMDEMLTDWPYVDEKGTLAGLVVVAKNNGRVIASDIEPTRMIAVVNGLLDPDTATLHEPSPDHVITSQWQVTYDPEATCPTIMAYLEEKMPGQVDAFLDTACRMLDCDRSAQDRALLLFGPSRSGKSTALGLLAEMVGRDARSSVTLHELGSSKFAAAQLVGKALNVANELHHGEVVDSSTFKSLTGGDFVTAEEKFEKPFHFRFHGLMAFATNEIPSLAGDSDAVVQRLVPIVCPRSFAGHEDESIKVRLYSELPGLLNELIRRHQLGRIPVPHPAVVGELRASFDRVRAWLEEGTEPSELIISSMTPVEAYQAFKRWLEENGYASPMNRPAFLKRLRSTGVGFSLVNGINRTGLKVRTSTPMSDYDRFIKAVQVVENGGLPTNPYTREERNIEREEIEVKSSGEVHHHRWATFPPVSSRVGISMVFAHLASLSDRVVAIDVETNGLDMDDMRVRTVQLGFRDGDEFHAHVVQIELPDGTHSPENAAAIATGLAAMSQTLWSYGTFDARAIRADPAIGIDIDIRDAMPLHHLVDSFEAGMMSPLKRALKVTLGAEPSITGDDTRSMSTGDPVFLEYASLDAVGLRMLLHVWLERADLDDLDGWLANEARLAGIAQSMSDHGLLVSGDAAMVMADAMRLEIDGLTERIAELAPGIKPGSVKMVGAVEERGVEVPRVRKKRRDGSVYYSPSIGHKHLTSDDELVVAVQEWRRLSSGLAALTAEPTTKRKGGMLHNLDEGGRIHGRFNPLGARTSRWSSSGPNLQNIPKKRRSAFVPAPGFVLVQADLSQIEYRVAAALSKDPAMEKAYLDGLDFHVYAAQILSGVEDPTPQQRQEAKAVGFGMIYGQSASTGARNARIEESEMQDRIDAYDGAFPKFRRWRADVAAQADFGTTPANPFGRKFNVPQGAGYMAVNYLCQSTAREVFSDWLIKVAERHERYLVAVVHDEIILEVPEDEAQAVLDYVIECAASCSIPGSGIPIVATGALAPNDWSEAY